MSHLKDIEALLGGEAPKPKKSRQKPPPKPEVDDDPFAPAIIRKNPALIGADPEWLKMLEAERDRRDLFMGEWPDRPAWTREKPTAVGDYFYAETRSPYSPPIVIVVSVWRVGGAGMLMAAFHRTERTRYLKDMPGWWLPVQYPKPPAPDPTTESKSKKKKG